MFCGLDIWFNLKQRISITAALVDEMSGAVSMHWAWRPMG